MEATVVRMAIFDSLMKSLKENATSNDLLHPFSQLDNDDKRIKHIMSLPAVQNIVVEDSFRNKDGLLSETLLQKGRQELDEDPRGAISTYTSAAKSAPTGSVILAQCYLARGHALQRIGFYREALEDARRSMDGSLSTDEIMSALKLEAMCSAELGQQSQVEMSVKKALQYLRSSTLDNAVKAQMTKELASIYKHNKNKEVPNVPREGSMVVPALDYGKNAIMPSASGALKLCWKPERGRHVIATRDISVGSVLIVENPYAWSLSTEAMAEHCLHCCRLSKAPLPCGQCATVAYCSKECREISWKQYHQFECRVLDHITQSEELNKMSLLSYRIVTTARLCRINHSRDMESPELQAKIDGKEQTELCRYIDESPQDVSKEFLSNAYSSVYGQLAHTECRTDADLFKRALSAVFLTKCLRHAVDCNVDEVCLAKALFRHIQSCSCNAYQISEQVVVDGNVREAEEYELGGAVYPTISLCNHGCCPNVVRNSYGNTCVVRASRRIRRGEEILDNYGPHYILNTKEERIQMLKSQYFFNCSCQPCRFNWPTAKELKTSVIEFKCIHCDHNLGEDGLNLKKCTRCKRKLNYKNVAKLLRIQDCNFKEAIDHLLEMNTRDSLSISIECYALLEPVIVEPNMELLKWRQVILACWSLQGNKNIK